MRSIGKRHLDMSSLPVSGKLLLNCVFFLITGVSLHLSLHPLFLNGFEQINDFLITRGANAHFRNNFHDF